MLAAVALPRGITAEVVANCPLSFATVSDATDGEALVVQTYRGLWDQVGGARLSPESIGAIVSGKDPFLIPEQKGEDLGTLQKRMKELEALADARGWNTPAIREAVLRDVHSRLNGTVVAIAKQDVAVRASTHAEVNFPEETISMLPPDGKSLVAVAGTKVKGLKGNAYPFVVYDIDTGKMEMRKGPPGPISNVSFSTDGQWLYSAAPGEQLLKVPYHGGHPDWSKAVTLGEKAKYNLTEGIALPTRDGQRVFVSKAFGKRPSHVFDIVTGERREIKLGKYDDKWEPENWGMVPGSDDLYFTVFNSEKRTTDLHRVTVDEKGKVEKDGPSVKLPSLGDPHVVWNPDGKQFLAYGKSEVVFSPGKKKEAALVMELPLGSGYHIESVALHPDGAGAAVLVLPEPRRLGRRANRNPPPPNPSRVEWIDLRTQKVTGAYELPEGWYSRLEFLPDGRVAIHAKESGRVTILNLKFRLNP